MTSQQRMAQVFTQDNFDELKKHAPEVISFIKILDWILKF